jgi:molybdopterin-biosynthesis enzyme MoeA-like protein
MKAIFHESIVPLLKEASGKSAFYEKSIYVDGVMESSLAPLIDKVMQVNQGVYVKSHPKGSENKPRIEIHLSTVSEYAEVAEKSLQKAAMQLSSLVGEVGGRIVVYG